MAENNYTTEFLQGLKENESLRPISEVIEQIMSIPEESLNESSKDIIIGMLNGAITPAIRETSIQEVLKNYNVSNYKREDVKNEYNSVKMSFEEIINTLQPSQFKKEMLESVFNVLLGIFEEAKNRFLKTDIDLLIKLDKGGKIPTYAHETDACADIYAAVDITLPPHSFSNMIPTGLYIALPENWVAKIAPRSSIGAKTGLRLSNSIGIIDADYRGEIGVLYDNFSDSAYTIKAGDRIAQMWVEPVAHFKPVIVDILPSSERGEGGFGSSGK